MQAVVASRQLKCFVDAPGDVVATMRTTVARVAGDWYYIDYMRTLQGCKKRLRGPVNATLVITFFGDAPHNEPPVPDAQPVPKPVPNEPLTQAQVHTYLQRLHVGLGHPSNSELIQHLKDAGAAPWLIRQAEHFQCAVCQSLQPPSAHNVVGGPKPRSFRSILAIDTLDLTLQRGGIQLRVFILTAIDTATSFARVMLLQAGDAATAVSALERGWIEPYGAPEYIYCDPDTIFRAEHLSQFLTRNAIVKRLSAAQAPYQHGQIERLHRAIRQQSQRVFESEATCSPYEAAKHVVQARNEFMRVEGVSPSVLGFGRLPKAPPSMAEGDEDFRMLSERLHKEDPLHEVAMQRRLAARTAWVQSEVRDRTARMQGARSRPYRGPYYRSQLVLVYRRKKGDAANPGRKGVWLGPGEVVATEASSDRQVPRIIYVTVHGRLFLCVPEQFPPIGLKAQWVRMQLKGGRGRPVPEPAGLLEEGSYEPMPQAPLTPALGIPAPGTPLRELPDLWLLIQP